MSHYKPYPAYKDSGVEWLGRVPEHWEALTLRRVVAAVKTGGTPSSESPSADIPDGVAWYTPGDFGSEMVLEAAGKRVSRTAISTGDVKVFPAGSILVVSIGATLGKVGFVAEEVSANQQINVVIPNARVDGYFLAYSLSVKTEAMWYLANAATIGIMNQEKTKDIWLAIPSIGEQKSIATHLDRETARIDALIEKKTRFIELLREKRQALITQAATRGLDPSVKMKDSGVEWLGEVPEHWEVRSVSSVSTKITNGYVGPTRDILVEEGVRYLQSLHIKGNQIKFDVPYFVTKDWSNQHRKSILETGDVLIVQTGDIGQATVVTDEFAGCNCHALIIVAPERSIIWGEWMSWVFNSSYGYHTLLSIQTGAMHPHLNCGNVKDVLLPVPPLTEQLEIVKHIEHEERRVAALAGKTERSIELLKERRSALITAAVTGQIDLREAV